MESNGKVTRGSPDFTYESDLTKLPDEMLKDRLEYLKGKSRKQMNYLVWLEMEIQEIKDEINNRKNNR